MLSRWPFDGNMTCPWDLKQRFFLSLGLHSPGGAGPGDLPSSAELTADRNIDVGSLGSVVFKKGSYVYVGSAMVNLAARIERHRRLRKQHHWHIHVLRDEAEFEGCLVIRSSTRLECDVAKAVSGIAEWSIPHFGSSDCSCETHLFGFTDNPVSSVLFQRVLQYFRMDRLNVSPCFLPAAGYELGDSVEN